MTKKECNLSEERNKLRSEIMKMMEHSVRYVPNKLDKISILNSLLTCFKKIKEQDKILKNKLKEAHHEWRKEGVVGEYFNDSFDFKIDGLFGNEDPKGAVSSPLTKEKGK